MEQLEHLNKEGKVQPSDSNISPTRIETDFETIKIVQLSGDIIGHDVARRIIREEMKKLGILDFPQKYLIRQVNGAFLHAVLLHGTERDKTSPYRDRLLEEDHELSPDEYICAHSFETGRGQRFIDNASYMIEESGRTITVFYNLQRMTPHLETKYDKAVDTACTYSFKDSDQKSKAVYAVIIYKGHFAGDYYQYAQYLNGLGRKKEAITAFKKFIASPPDAWSIEKKKKWIDRANEHITRLQSK